MKRRKKTISEKLGAYVRERYRLAAEAKRDLHDSLTRCVELLSGISAPDADGVDVSMNITAPIVRGVKGLLRDILANDMDAPFTIAATPIPELPREIEDRLAAEIQRAMPDINMLTGGDPVRNEELFKKMRNTAVLMMNREASKAARKMETQVKDDLLDADWGTGFEDFLYNLSAYPFAVLKVPSPRMKRVKRWNGRRLGVEEKLVRKAENISPFDYFWAPNSTPDYKEYEIERRKIGADELLALLTEPTYDAELIEHILDTLPDGHTEPYPDGRDLAPTGDDSIVPDAVDSDAINTDVGYYDALGFFGRIKGKYLKEFGLDVEDERNWYEAEVWTIDDIVFRVALNPDPLGDRPFRVASYDALPGQISGSCPTLRLEDTQRVCNAAIRALIRNMALSSGVVGEVDAGRIADDDDPRILQAHVLRLVNPGRNGDNRTAYHFHTIESHAAELMGVFDKFLAMGYEVLGVPRMAFGSTDGLGTIGRTSGGMSMVMNQASKTLKDVLRAVEKKVIEPGIQSFVDWQLLYSDDPTIKGDIRVYARGVSGILEKESQREKLSWALQSIGPLVTAQVIPQQAVLRLVYQLFQAQGIPTDGILPDFDGDEAGAADMAMLTGGAPQGGGQLALPGSETQLDGRSANAMQAIESMNSLG